MGACMTGIVEMFLMNPVFSPLETDWIPRFLKNLLLRCRTAHLIHWTLFCCRPAGPGDQAVQDGGGLLVFRAQGTEGQHGEDFTYYGLKKRRGQTRPARSVTERGFSSRARRETSSLFSSPTSPLIFLLLLSSCARSLLPSPANPVLLRISSHPHFVVVLFSPSSHPVGLHEPSAHPQPLPHAAQRGKKRWRKHQLYQNVPKLGCWCKV